MDAVLEIITGRERRRRWGTPFKLRVVAKPQESGAQVPAVAARYGVCESLVLTWWQQVREEVLRAPKLPMFLPVQVYEPPQSTAAPSRPEQPVALAPSPVMPPTPAPPRPLTGLIGIELGDGRMRT